MQSSIKIVTDINEKASEIELMNSSEIKSNHLMGSMEPENNKVEMNFGQLILHEK